MKLGSAIILAALLQSTVAVIQQLQRKNLGCYGANASMVSVGGFSSGSIFSAHLFTVLSSKIMGLAMLDGAPFGCGKTTQPLPAGIVTCAQAALLPDTSIDIAKSLADNGEIDPVSNMADKPVYILNHKQDVLVNPNNGKLSKAFFEYFGCDVAAFFNYSGNHGMPTTNYGCPCFVTLIPWINDCNYNGAYESLQHIYKNLQRPNDNFKYCPSSMNAIDQLLLCQGSLKLEFCNSNSTEINCNFPGELYQFNQDEFADSQTCFDSVGYIYIPSNCKNNTSGCRLHVANHGCLHARQFVCEKFVKHAGYLEVAEMNNIIIVFPQMVLCVNFFGQGFPGANVAGCHDWYGFTGSDYITRTGKQIVAYHKIIQRITSTTCDP
ncbi:hypothetical protein CHUAL_011754 [Chamberlinius hualienensis]